MKNFVPFIVMMMLLSSCVEETEKVELQAEPEFSCLENQRCPDRGNGTYSNPVLGGDYPDPSVIRVGDDFYMTHSSFEYYPGLLVWHSKDLVNWEPISRALYDYVGSVWAPELVKHGDTYYIYLPANNTNYVVTAASPEGPWSKPIDLKVSHIDPGHVVGPDGTRYLHLSDGYIVQLADDGLSVVGEQRKIYDGWEFPAEWNAECFCLESPKMTVKDGYYYLTVAEGGTAGPATSHMVVSARSKNVDGPWEHSPYNPIVHTAHKSEQFWSRGHGTLVDDAEGNWFIMYHGYEKNYFTLGRQTLMEPIEWTDDGWFKVPEGTDVASPNVKPAGVKVTDGMPLSDDFSGDNLDIQWHSYRDFEPERLTLTGNSLVVQAKGKTPTNCSPLLCVPVNYSYEITVEVQLTGNCSGGLVLYYSPNAYCGIGIDRKRFMSYMRGGPHQQERNTTGTEHAFLRLVNDQHEISTYHSQDGKQWTKSDRSMESSGYHHNTFGGFLSLRAGIFAAGEGKVEFRNFTYRGL